jgi:hypothetical protein
MKTPKTLEHTAHLVIIGALEYKKEYIKDIMYLVRFCKTKP